jgi:hypothetical protein
MVIEPFSTALVWGCRISCYAALDTTACAAFIKESRMECDNASQLSQEIRVRPKTGPARTSSPTAGKISSYTLLSWRIMQGRKKGPT